MALKIKHYAKSGQVRSVGDAPNGLVAVSLFDGPHFVVHPKVVPPPAGKPGEILVAHKRGGTTPEEDGASAITVEEAIEAALHCKRTPWVLWESAYVAMITEAERLHGSFDVEAVEAAVQFTKEVRDQLAVNGLLSKEEK